MKYQLYFWFVVLFCWNVVSQDDLQLQVEQNHNIEQMQKVKSMLQEGNQQKKDKIFNNLQIYGQCAGQVATTAVLLAGNKQKNSSQARLSTTDQANIIQTVVACFLLMVEFARFCSNRKDHKRLVRAMNYQEFIAMFPHLVLVEYQITVMKTLIRLSTQNDFAQNIFACIQLTKMSLVHPYEKFCNKAAKKMYKQCFDQFGNFVLTDLPKDKHPYKKFCKKVDQSWQELALKVAQFPDAVLSKYDSKVAKYIDTPYNNTLIKMIHAGIKGDLQSLTTLRNGFASDPIVVKLFDHYNLAVNS